jgi:hypothetical protein
VLALRLVEDVLQEVAIPGYGAMKRIVVSDADGTLVRGEEAIAVSSSQGGDGVEWHYFTQRSGFPLLPRRGGGEQRCESNAVAVGFTTVAKAGIASQFGREAIRQDERDTTGPTDSGSSSHRQHNMNLTNISWSDVVRLAAACFRNDMSLHDQQVIAERLCDALEMKNNASPIDEGVVELNDVFNEVGIDFFAAMRSHFNL